MFAFEYFLFQSECRELFCPANKIPFAGACLPAVSEDNDLSLEIYFRIQFAGRFLPQAHSLHSALVSNILDKELELGKECSHCDSVLYMNEGSHFNMFYLKITIQTSIHCTFAKIIQDIRKHFLVSLSLTVSMFGQLHELSVMLELDDVPTNMTTLSWYSVKYVCPAAVRLDHTILHDKDCPSLLLSDSQLRKMGINDSFIQTLLKTQEMDESKSKKYGKLCVSDYMEIAKDFLLNRSAGILFCKLYTIPLFSIAFVSLALQTK